jgi:hypothetical protein
MRTEHRRNDTDRENNQALGQKTLFITNPTAIGLGLNPVLRDQRPVARRPKHGRTQIQLRYKTVDTERLERVAYANFTSNQVFEVGILYNRALSITLLHSGPVTPLNPENRSKLR